MTNLFLVWQVEGHRKVRLLLRQHFEGFRWGADPIVVKRAVANESTNRSVIRVDSVCHRMIGGMGHKAFTALRIDLFRRVSRISFVSLFKTRPFEGRALLYGHRAT
jgi:hypothetical protein